MQKKKSPDFRRPEVGISADVGWVVIPYKATQILLLIAIKSASLTI